MYNQNFRYWGILYARTQVWLEHERGEEWERIFGKREEEGESEKNTKIQFQPEEWEIHIMRHKTKHRDEVKQHKTNNKRISLCYLVFQTWDHTHDCCIYWKCHRHANVIYNITQHEFTEADRETELEIWSERGNTKYANEHTINVNALLRTALLMSESMQFSAKFS